jgi:hypothetical protein
MSSEKKNRKYEKEKQPIRFLYEYTYCVDNDRITCSYRKVNARADPIVCGLAVFLAMPFLFFVLTLSKDHLILTWIFIFCAETLLCSNWALISDMLMVRVFQ